MARPKNRNAGGPSAPRAVGAGCIRTVGSNLADPLYAARPTGVHRAPHPWHGVHTPRHRGVHTGLVRPRQSASHVIEGPLWLRQQDGVGVAGATPAPASGERRGRAGALGVKTVARGVMTTCSRPPPLTPYDSHTYTQRAHDTHSPAGLPLPVGRHPGHCLLVTAPSAQHNTTQPEADVRRPIGDIVRPLP